MPSLLEHFRGEEIIADHFDTENRAFFGALFFVWVVAGATGNGRNCGVFWPRSDPFCRHGSEIASSSLDANSAMNYERAASNSSKTLYDSSRSICPATGINTSAPRMTITRIAKSSTSPASNEALWATIATMKHRLRMLMCNS